MEPGIVYPRVLEWKGMVFTRQERMRRAWSNMVLAPFTSERRLLMRQLAGLATDRRPGPSPRALRVRSKLW